MAEEVRRPRLHHPLRHVASVAVVALAGFMMTTAAVNSRGQDLRPDSNADLADVVAKQAAQNDKLSKEAAALRAQIDQLSRHAQANPSTDATSSALAPGAGLQAVKGPALEIILDDAPLSVNPQGVDANMLVVHQQDIQMVVNTLWSGGAEAMTIQGQRVTSTTAVKCVGNTVVLHGVPYAPPYRIAAIGDVDAMRHALDSSESVRIYKEYVTAYQLGWSVQGKGVMTMPAFKGTLTLDKATPVPR
ncbi:DUF881 domain-containing protein [Acidipropionibacterium timonense]|uniref:DUF881 domain-containing protein n=1 Tax=Acidipropionibacterium timonense TaxID=2161818 RepID=UPI001030DB46